MAFRLLAQHRSAGGIDPRAKFRERDERRSTIATLSKRCWPVESTKLRCLPSVVGTERERSRKCPIQATMKSQSQSRGLLFNSLLRPLEDDKLQEPYRFWYLRISQLQSKLRWHNFTLTTMHFQLIESALSKSSCRKWLIEGMGDYWSLDSRQSAYTEVRDREASCQPALTDHRARPTILLPAATATQLPTTTTNWLPS